jgi:hypothetical protein
MLRARAGSGMDSQVHDWRFDAAAAKVSDPAENCFLSSPRGRVYPNRASGSGEAFGMPGCSKEHPPYPDTPKLTLVS